MKFEQALNEKVKEGVKRFSKSVKGSTPSKMDDYLDSLDKRGITKDIEKGAKKAGLKKGSKRWNAYVYGTKRKIAQGHFD